MRIQKAKNAVGCNFVGCLRKTPQFVGIVFSWLLWTSDFAAGLANYVYFGVQYIVVIAYHNESLVLSYIIVKIFVKV